jgi:hypothetical protein
MIVWNNSKIEDISMYSPVLIRYDWQVKKKCNFWIVQLKTWQYQTCSVTAVKHFLQGRGMWLGTVVKIYYLMLSDRLALFILFITVRIIVIIITGSFIRPQYYNQKGLIKVNKNQCYSKDMKSNE